MKLRVTHRTEYRYALPVHGNTNELRVTPLTNRRQKHLMHVIRVVPATRLERYHDLHRNPVHRFEVEEPHTALTIEAVSLVETLPGPSGLLADDPAKALLGDESLRESFQPYLLPDGPVLITPQIWRAAIDIEQSSRGIHTMAMELMRTVHAGSTYAPGATHIGTTTEEFFNHRKGVCQDYAHLLLALCRAVGLPARYVCGYVYDARRGEIIGGHASHAWCEVWLPGQGWLGLDPTNGKPVTDAYVAAAVGRDYRDATPVSGSYWGSGDREMRITVHLEAR